jgi:hypothetical protein
VSTEQVLADIDGALVAYGTASRDLLGPDAMRWLPDAPQDTGEGWDGDDEYEDDEYGGMTALFERILGSWIDLTQPAGLIYPAPYRLGNHAYRPPHERVSLEGQSCYRAPAGFMAHVRETCRCPR